MSVSERVHFLKDRIFDPDGDVVLELTEVEICNGDESVLSALARNVSDDDEPMAKASSPEDTEKEVPKKVRMLVSSSHLSLASPVFKAMLRGGYKETQTLASGGKAEIALPEDDSEALTILLNIIHNHPIAVPRTLDLYTLTEVATLVDKYQFHDAVDMFKEKWMQGVQRDLRPEYTPELLQWLWICHVFALTHFSKDYLGCAIAESTGNLAKYTENLPLPLSIISAIEQRRIFALSEICEEISWYLARYRDHRNPYCRCHSEDCDSMVLGGLVRDLTRMDFYPLPEAPFDRVALATVCTSLKQMSLKTFCEFAFREELNSGSREFPYRDSRYPLGYQCGLKHCDVSSAIIEMAEHVRTAVMDLDLDSLLGKEEIADVEMSGTPAGSDWRTELNELEMSALPSPPRPVPDWVNRVTKSWGRPRIVRRRQSLDYHSNIS